MTDATPRDRMRRAVRAVRREARKVAVVHATADATVATLAASLAVELVGVAALPAAVPRRLALPPAAVAAGLPPALDAAALVGAAAGLVVLVAGLAVRLRRPAVERFEAVNPPVAEALRTGRDALAAGREGPMADRLYESVTERLGETSSLGLLRLRRLAAALVLVGLLSTATVGTAAVDVGLGTGTTAGTPDDGTRGPPPEDRYTGLENPDEVLGEPEDVSAGSEPVNATVGTRAGTNGSASAERYATGGFASDAAVESQQAGFAEQERLEDAELIREYNLRIREES